ncbi:VPS35 endosomal protein sorting factor-like isoform X2 [Punica granatum]|uniref:VPS35 endosomal protein sorting factor-like isoform X2 n=1 Tax=Punica granatum TaxID=22663 RepID=A0A218X9B1_PUNGR|nr:VPS35 endosomal protein sorting factor-like isoform X2 [Punica granatum]OWM81289.1 hypothetical protein CDL15_Pgr007327 [Punica granatum]
MEFRARDYKAESEAHALPRKRADGDPLSAPAVSHPQVDIVEDKGEEFFDPLREPNSNVVGSLDTEDDIGHPSVVVSTEVPGQENAKREWTSFKRFLMQRFPVSKMVSISAMSDGILRSGKGYEKLSMSTDPDELDDSQKFSEEGIRSIARQEYISRLKEFKEKFADAWQSGDRVTSLKLAIKVAKLLTDTSVGQFYPTLFVLATDIMEMLGDMVWERVKQKAEYAEDGTFLCSLPASFRADDVGLDAKETCNNWFCKIGSVKELLPRIYLELALLPCWRFLVDQPIDSIQRLVMMARGVADPLACSYCRLYIARCAQKLPSVDTGSLIRCINDTKHLLMHSMSLREGSQESSKDRRKSLVSLMEPSIEYIMRHIFQDASLKLLESAVVEFGLGNTEAHGSNPSISIIVHNLIKELPVDMVNSKTIDIINLIECCNDYTLDQCLNYRLLGFRLSESKYSLHIVTVVDRVIRVVSQKDMLDEYLKVVDAYVDLIFQNHMDDHLVKILDGISKRICNKGMVGDELACLQSILVKLLSHFKNLEDIFSLNHFLEILDMMYGRSRMIVNMHILDKATRGGLICDPTTIQLLFEVSQALNDSIDQVNVRDEDLQQPARMISRFIDKVSYGADRERHLAFLVECRRAFGSTNELKETLVHSSNSLAVKALIERKNHLDFLKSCIAFSEVTISSVTALVRQLKLYLETAEVALLGGLVSHSDGLVQSAISCMQSVDLVDVSRGPTDADETLNFLQKICGFLIILPGNPEKGAVYTPKSLFALLNSQSWMTPRMRARICCAMISLSATLSQKNLPYHASKSGIPSNDILFYGNSAYFGELVSFSEEVVRKLVDAIKQEPSPVARGSMALEACNCIALSFKMSCEISAICFELLEMARRGLGAKDRYLKSTINLMDSYSTSPQLCQ